LLLRDLELKDFRSYRTAELSFEAGATVVVGPNAHGKTNLLEAVQRAATGSSHRVSGDAPLVRQGADAAYVRLALETDLGRRRTVELALQPGRGTHAKVDGQDVRRAAGAVGVVRAVLVAPEDLEIIRGEPSGRRRLLDDVLSQRRPAYAATRADYERVLRQRNQLLRTSRGIEGTPSTLTTWTEQLVEHGAPLLAARLAAVTTMAEPANDVYGRIADRAEPIDLRYRSTALPEGVTGEADLGTIRAALRHGLDEVAEEERARGVTLVGPHRDDLEITLRGLPARGYASHGQLWSLVLALRLAAATLIAETGDGPVLLFDDVFAELDDSRRRRLADLCGGAEQVIVTTAVEGDVPLGGARLDVRMERSESHVERRSEVPG
jgi:DNA replication and repair protein RecF